jgi:hypothetical protein
LAVTNASRSAIVASKVFVFDVGVTYDTVIFVSKNAFLSSFGRMP